MIWYILVYLCLLLWYWIIPAGSLTPSVFIMDVLRPVLVNINGRIYRKNPIQEEDYEEEEEDYSYSETGLCF